MQLVLLLLYQIYSKFKQIDLNQLCWDFIGLFA